MFRRQFRVKSNTQLKNTERKALRDNFLRSFPCLKDDDLNNILPKKEIAFCMRILTADTVPVLVYIVLKRAIAFEIYGVLYPSVYLLWRYVDLVLNFTTTPYVVAKLMKGADLMLPGVVVNMNGYGSFEERHVTSVNTNSNKAPVAVGITAITSHDLDLHRARGKCVVIYHTHGDKLCSLEDMPVLPIPDLGPPQWLIYSLKSTNEFPPLRGNVEPSAISPVENETSAVAEIVEVPDEEPVEKNISEIEEMDNILMTSFLTAIKYSKTLQLPMLTSAFYKLEVMPLCPPDKNFDIKKTTYKKVGQFMRQMNKEGLILVREKKKGVETVELINDKNPKYLNFYIDVDSRPKKPVEQNVADASGPSIVESYVITNAVVPIFEEFGLKKGDTLQPPDVRRHITAYVKNHDYQSKENQRLVQVNESPFAPLCKNEVAVSWEELMEKVCSAMKSCYKVTSGHEETVSKGKIPSIQMAVQTRSGNKKVTLIDNLELYGIRISEFAKDCQHGVAASTSTTRSPGRKSDQLLVQGNQILFVYNLLVDKYKIPKKYIRGLENAPKTRK